MFRIVSDLHLEAMSTNYSLPIQENEETSILILAGDICEFRLLGEHDVYDNFLENCNNRFNTILYIPGNHEYYGSSLNDFEKYKSLLESRYKNIQVMNCDKEVISTKVESTELNFNIICATMWTDINGAHPFSMLTAHSFMRHEYHVIDGFSPEVWVEENEKARSFIESEIYEASVKKELAVVITHHGPSMKSVHPRHEAMGHDINSLFMNNDLEHLFREPSLKLWIHGHTHDTVDYYLGDHGCRVIANPKGLTRYTYYDDELLMSHQNRYYDDQLRLFCEDLYF
jgi:predicted phosphodiesterase